MKKIIEYIESIDILENLMLVSIASSRGSTPRKAGAMMVVGIQGLLTGSIGGGLLEYVCVKKAQDFLNQEVSVKSKELDKDTLEWEHLEHFELDNTKAGALGMVCGGNTDVLFQNLTYSVLCDLKQKVEQEKEHRVILVGGGHVALAVSQLLQFLSFPYILVEDREEFASKERFPEAREIVLTEYESIKDAFIKKNIILESNDAVCIVTRGHAGDTKVARYALQTEVGYIGAMGSRRKRELILAQLEKEGFQNVREKITTPIGLDIGAQTPEELAVSIVAQLIAWRAGK